MGIPASGAVSLLDLQNEFGGANPISINEYYRGGALVPNTSNNTGIPTSGTISLDDFHGSSALQGTLSPGNAFGSTTVGGACTTNTVVASGSHNSGTLSYVYAFVSGDAFTRNGSGASASFTANVSGANPDKDATWKVTITDSAGGSIVINFNVHVSFVI